MVATARLLGFAFANADLLFEIDRDATVVFATGAASEFVTGKDKNLVGGGAARLFEPSDGVKFVTYAKALGEGGRVGPLRLKLAGGKATAVSLCHLPQNGDRISCTLTRPGPRQGFGPAKTDPKTGLSTKDGFLVAASQMADGKSAMTLVDVPSLDETCAKLRCEEADRLMQQIGEAVKAAGSHTAARLGETTFGTVGKAGKKGALAANIQTLLKDKGFGHVKTSEMLVMLAGGALSPEQRLLAVRHVVERFTAGKVDAKPGADLAAVFDHMVGATQERALALTDALLQGAFRFAYQPVVTLADGSIAFCEALARFDRSSNTAETVAFAEALGISDAFDVAVAAKILSEAERNAMARVAFNLSGNTIATPMTFGLVAGLLAKHRALAGRVLIEVTETAEIGDLAMANQAIQTMRGMGCKVGLDDFGAGAASFQYLHAFDIDFVKFDAGLIARLGNSTREDMLVGGLVKLCGELGVVTVAEGIETAKLAKLARTMGFDLGQGYHLGKPLDELALPAEPSQVSTLGKRKGVQVSWG